MSRSRALGVQCDMTFPSSKAATKLTRRISVVGFVMVLAGGCGPRLEVLEGTDGKGGDASAAGAPGDAGEANAGSSGAGTTGGEAGGGSGGVGGAGDATGVGGKSLCAGEYSQEELVAATMGQPCSDKDICEPNACASIGMPEESNTATFVTCRNRRAQVVAMTLLDVPASERWAVREGAASWDDCESALDDGLSGDTCTWLQQTCIRHTADPCCLEGAQCSSFALLTPPEGLLQRVRFCAPGCTDVSPDSTEPVVTDCETAAAADTCHETPACEGDFICHRTAGESSVDEYTEASGVNGAMWCAGGVLVGGYGLSWGF